MRYTMTEEPKTSIVRFKTSETELRVDVIAIELPRRLAQLISVIRPETEFHADSASGYSSIVPITLLR
jgi:hypothetical protein